MVASLITSSFHRFQLTVPIVTVDGNETVIWLTGDQDFAVVEALRAAMTAATSSESVRPRQVVVDLRGVTFIDSPTARALIDAALTQPGASASLTLRAASPCVRRMLRICGRGDLLEVA